VDGLTLLRQQIALVESLIPQIAEQITPQRAAWRAEGSTTNPIGLTLLHMFQGEDAAVQEAQSRPPLFQFGNRVTRMGVETNDPWKATATPDLPALWEYGAAVAAATSAWLDTVSPAVLDEQIETPRGPRPRAVRLSLSLVMHKMTHLGEVAALLGMQGIKGFPV
jgi:hypothetical protein